MARAYNLTPEGRARISGAVKASWDDPTGRENRIALTTASWKNPDVRGRRLIGMAEGIAARAWMARAPKVPNWCPPSLAGEYLPRALEYDEFDAAKHIRSLLREAK